MWTVFAERQKMGLVVASFGPMGLAFTLGILWFLVNPGPVHACKCAQPGSPSEELEKFSSVFAGRVVSIQHSYVPNGTSVTPEDRTTVRLEVSAVWKGLVHEDMYITTPPTGGNCGFTFDEGEEYIVYANDSPYAGGGYTAGICSRTALLGRAQDDLDALGEGQTPQAGTGGLLAEQAQEPISSRAWLIIPAVAAMVLMVGGIVAYRVARRR